jgi:hypothetical protein
MNLIKLFKGLKLFKLNFPTVLSIFTKGNFILSQIKKVSNIPRKIEIKAIKKGELDNFCFKNERFTS